MNIPKIKRVALSNLRPNDENPRSIKDHKFAKLVMNMEQFPDMLLIRPIVHDESGRILGGNMRYRAAEHLGWKDIPAVDAKELTDEQKRAFVILDNQDFGEWDFEALANQYDPQELEDMGFEPTELGINLKHPDQFGDHEVEDGEYQGLPEYIPKKDPYQLVVQCETEEDRAAFMEMNQIVVSSKNGMTLSCWWPAKEKSDNSSVKFEEQ